MSSAETQGQYNYHNMLVHLCYMIVLLLFVLQMEHCYLYNFSFLRQMWPYPMLAILFMPFYCYLYNFSFLRQMWSYPILAILLMPFYCYLYNFSFLRQMWPYPILAILFMSFSFIAPKTIKLVGFPIFWLWAYIIKIIVEGRRSHYIWYLRFYKYIAIIMLTTRAIVHHITLKEVNQNEVGIK